MEFIQVLIIIGIVVFAVVKQLLKTEEKAPEKKHPEPYLPAEYDDYDDDILYTKPEPVKRKAEPFLSFDNQQPISGRTIPTHKSSPPLQEEPDEEREFNIESAEEVRRGIIWSEILKRKY